MNYNQVKDAPISEELLEKDFPKSNTELSAVWPSSPVSVTTFDPTYRADLQRRHTAAYTNYKERDRAECADN